MDNYSLKENESLLYKGDAYGMFEILLTNINLVLIKKIKVKDSKKLFAKTYEQTDISVYSTDEIKIYKDVPQVKVKDSTVEIYLASGEEKINFYSKIEAHKFANAIYELLTGKTLATRGAEKVKSAINIVDEALGINTVSTVKNVMENGIAGTILGGVGKKATKFSKTSSLKESIGLVKKVVDAASPTTDLHNNAEQDDYNDKVEKIKKLKELLDIEAITQEEFDAKKKELLGL